MHHFFLVQILWQDKSSGPPIAVVGSMPEVERATEVVALVLGKQIAEHCTQLVVEYSVQYVCNLSGKM